MKYHIMIETNHDSPHNKWNNIYSEYVRSDDIKQYLSRSISPHHPLGTQLFKNRNTIYGKNGIYLFKFVANECAYRVLYWACISRDRCAGSRMQK